MCETRKLNIVHVTTVHSANDSRIFEKECQSLAAAGHTVTLVATGTAPAESGSVRVFTTPRIKRRMLRFVLGPLRALWIIERLRPDVIHLHDPELIPAGVFLRLRGYPVIFDSHEDIPESMGFKPYLPLLLRRGAQFASRGLVWLVNESRMRPISATEHIAARFPGSGVVQNFPRLGDWIVADLGHMERGHLVFVGGITETRGLWPMVGAASLLRQRGREVKLSLAGPIADELLERLSSYVESGLVDYHGVLDRREVAELLADSDIGLVLYDPSPNNRHGKPTKIFEYMAAGIPSVASDFPLWRELVLDPDAGLVADPLCADSIADAVSELLGDPERAAGMGKRGRRWVEAHRNWDSEARVLLEVYAGICGP